MRGNLKRAREDNVLRAPDFQPSSRCSSGKPPLSSGGWALTSRLSITGGCQPIVAPGRPITKKPRNKAGPVHRRNFTGGTRLGIKCPWACYRGFAGSSMGRSCQPAAGLCLLATELRIPNHVRSSSNNGRGPADAALPIWAASSLTQCSKRPPPEMTPSSHRPEVAKGGPGAAVDIQFGSSQHCPSCFFDIEVATAVDPSKRRLCCFNGFAHPAFTGAAQSRRSKSSR
jgi:hypothetical protein